MAFAARTVVLGSYVLALLVAGRPVLAAAATAVAVAGVWLAPLARDRVLTRPGHALAPAGRPGGNP